MRKRLRVALGLVVAGVLVVPAAVAGVHVTHPRDEDGFLAYLKQYGDFSSDAPLPVLRPAAALIAEGDTACEWMREQPYAFWRSGSRYEFHTVYQRYLGQVTRAPSWGTALPETRTVVAAAWAYLCPADWELREPRWHPFKPLSD